MVVSAWLITGCSTGLGRNLAEAILQNGHNAVVTARDPARVQDLADSYPRSALTLPLDVTDREQIARAVQQAEARFGGIDVLINNAGYGYLAAIEEGDESEVARLFATDFFGAVAMIKAVLPGMRARRSGTIANISSMGARICPAGSGYYSAAKGALESMSGSLRKEVKPLGITVTVIEPGALRTEFAGLSRKSSSTVIHDYAETVGKRRRETHSSNAMQPGDPAMAAQAIIAALEAPQPPDLLVVGKDALNGVRAELDTIARNIDAWQEISLGSPTVAQPP